MQHQQRHGLGYPGILSSSCSPSELIGASPFDLCLVNSTILMTINDASSIGDNGVMLETMGTILQMAADDQAEEGDGGGSNVEEGGGWSTSQCNVFG